ncbi:alpha-2,8-sialyltransferase 8B-like [Anneissia japonica]|uniref:alpha-2,8-sialyltransferase 8B-like n=1 Tax=Anneissia japonica TaxID=1529436 RepID=UPI0014257A61|nr:alpha-2,8-sialyltransferase 8B-like [Anneissia japonica]XP_033107988.1 alpha-2,8-sialyltransferase 8B-like [Anneissia japonica]
MEDMANVFKMKVRKPRIKFKPALFLCLVSASIMMYLIIDVPISYPIPRHCQPFQMNAYPFINKLNNTSKTWVQNTVAARKIRKLSSNCLPTQNTLMVYAANNNVDDIDFKQGFNPIEYIAFLYDGKTGTPQELPAKFEKVKRQHHCAIIGNSGILLNSSCGEEIDSNHDFVMRSNFAPIESYMKDVGVKTNLTVINIEKIRQIANILSVGDFKDPVAKMMFRRLKFLNDSVVWFPKGTRFRFYIRTKLQYIAKQLKTKYHLPLKIGYSWRNLEALIKWFWSMQEFYTTTGLNMYTVATTFCDQITLYGFYPFHVDKDSRRIPHHYYEDIPYEYDNKVHSFHEEFDRLKTLHTMGALRLVTDRCNGDKPSTISLPKK